MNGGPGNTGWTLSVGSRAHIQRWVLPSDPDGCSVNYRYAASAANMHFPGGSFYEVGVELFKRQTPNTTFYRYEPFRETTRAHVLVNYDHAIPAGCTTSNNASYTTFTVVRTSGTWYQAGYDCANGSAINWDGGVLVFDAGQSWGYATTETERFASTTSYRPTNNGLEYWDGAGGLHPWPGVHCFYDTDTGMYINPSGNTTWWPNMGADPPGYLCDRPSGL